LTEPLHVAPADRSLTRDGAAGVRAELGHIAARAGLRRVHLIAWRDLDDPEAGGSEVHAAAVARLWSEAGIDVMMRTSFAEGLPAHARRDGYEVVRRGGRYAVFPRTALAEIARRHGRRDGLVEIWNGMPFLSPVWSTGARVVVLHHVHAEMWAMALPRPLAILGDTLERRVAPLLYRRSHMITLSPSSKAEMLEIGFRDERVEVVPPGVDPRFSPGGRRDPGPTVLAVGRLAPVKRFDRLIRCVVEARLRAPDLTLTIVGFGDLQAELEALVTRLDAGHAVSFTGPVSDEDLLDRYRRSWMVASTSAREGWGMTLTEAAACGTPAVATRIAGHADAVDDGTSGLLAEDDRQFTDHLVAIATDPTLRDRLGAGALAHAARFTWEATATRILAALAFEACRRRSGPVPSRRRRA